VHILESSRKNYQINSTILLLQNDVAILCKKFKDMHTTHAYHLTDGYHP